MRGAWLLLLAVGLPMGAVAQGSLDAGSPPRARHALGGDWYFGGRLEGEYRRRNDYDLDASHPDDQERLTLLHPSLAVAWRPAAPWSAYLNLEYQKHHYLSDEGRPTPDRAQLLLDKLFIDYQGDWGLVRLGRQRIKHPREWMIDDTQDGLRLYLQRPRWRLDLALLRERAFDEELLHGDTAKRVDSLWLRLSRPAEEAARQALFLMLQDDKERNERAAWLGLEWLGEWEALDYWLLGALVQGEKRGRELSGYGFDLGGLLRLVKRPRLYLVAGYAFGSGHEKDVDLGFRQTGFQDNSAKLGGVTRFSYYGELLDPELGNLSILTLGLGSRPRRDYSMHLMWHRYRQHHPLDELRDSDLDRDPEGRHTDLGQGLDLILGYRIRGRFKAEMVLARFWPGKAYGEADPATLVRLELKYNW